VALVTGASRGVGKGVALGLGEAGATVYVTGRTVAAGQAPWPGTIGETAAQVTELGGCGIAVPCDHSRDAEIEALFQRIRDEQGWLDILVNNVYATPSGPMPMGVPFWELPPAFWDELNVVGPRSHYAASWFAVPLMLAREQGLIVNISSSGAEQYLFGVAYGAQKAAIDKLTRDMAHELRGRGVTVVSLWPGMVKVEKTLAHPERLPADAWERLMREGESPIFSGRAVVALASDPNILEKSGQALVVAELARQYGFTDPG
jgi:dehydrogenase/reductase SDR family protein 1